MGELYIPYRPANYDYKAIKKADCDCLTAVVLLGIRNEDAFRLFHPEYLDERGKLSEHAIEVSRQFFNIPKHKEYLKAFRAEIADFCRGKGGSSSKQHNPDSAAQTYRDKVYDAIDAVDASDIDAMKTVGDLGKTVKIFKEEEQQQESPRRYLPERCFSGCRYRLFVESAVTEGSVIDECRYCKALTYAIENGYRDNSTNRLDLPTKSK